MLTASWFIHSFRKCSLPCVLWVWLVNVSCRLTDLDIWFGLQLEAQFGEVKEPLGGGSLLPRVCHRGWALWFYKPGFASFSFLLLVWRRTPKSQLPGHHGPVCSCCHAVPAMNCIPQNKPFSLKSFCLVILSVQHKSDGYALLLIFLLQQGFWGNQLSPLIILDKVFNQFLC